MINIHHKKTFGLLFLFILLILGFVVFFNPIVQGVANTFLKDLDPPLRSEISELDSDLSKGMVTFKFQTLPKDGEPRLVKVDQVTLDADLDFQTSVVVEDIDIQLNRHTLQELTAGPKSEQEEKTESSPLSFVKYLSSFALKDFDLRLIDSGVKLELEELLVNFDGGTGYLQEIRGVREGQDFTFIDVPKIELGFADNLADAEKKRLTLNIPAPRFFIDQALIDTVFSFMPQDRQAQTDEKEKVDPMNLSKFIDWVRVSDLRATAIGDKKGLTLEWRDFEFNLIKEAMILEDLSILTDAAPALLGINRIRTEFNSQTLLGEKPDLAVQINGIRTHIKKDSLAVLEGLPKPPETNKNSESANPIAKFSFIAAADSEVVLEEKKIRVNLEKFLLNARQGKLILEGLTSTLTTENKPFMRLATLSSQFDPAEFGQATTPSIGLTVNNLHMDVSNKLLNTLSSSQNKKKKSGPPDPLPLEISRVLVGDTSVDFLDFPGIGDEDYLRVKDIFGSIYNITMAPGTPLANFTFNASLDGESKFIVNGKFDLADDPFQWSLNYRLFDFDMTKLNDELRARVPLTFNDGVLDFYGEAIKRDEKIVGYYKPILDDGDYIGNENEFKGIKHFLVEAAATVGSWLFERDESDTLAVRVPFEVKDGKLDTDVSKAVWSAVEHGLLETDRIEPGVEQKYQLKQAQEEE